MANLDGFAGHVERFLEAHPTQRSWTVQPVAIAPVIDVATRAAITERGVAAQDLTDLLNGLAG